MLPRVELSAHTGSNYRIIERVVLSILTAATKLGLLIPAEMGFDTLSWKRQLKSEVRSQESGVRRKAGYGASAFTLQVES